MNYKYHPFKHIYKHRNYQKNSYYTDNTFIPPDLNGGGDKGIYEIYNKALNLELCFKI